MSDNNRAQDHSNAAVPPSLSRLQSRSRPRHSRSASAHSVPYLSQGPDALIYPEGSVSEEAVELLHEFVHPAHRDKHKRRADTEDTLVQDVNQFDNLTEEEAEEEAEDWDAMQKRPWYKRPSPWWILGMVPFSAIAMSACAAPRVEIYTELACRAHKPEYTVGDRYARPHEPVSESLSISSALGDTSSAFDTRPLYIDSLLNGITVQKDDKQQKCAEDPVVQAAAAKLIAVLTTTMGVLGCLTTAWWGSLSDRYGRLRVMGISVFGLLATDFAFIVVYFFSQRLPGGYWFLILGPFVEGMLGGMSSAVAAVHSYIADCTVPAARSRTLSLSLGLLFVGMALGPTLGGLLIRVTQQTIVVFYLGTAVHCIYALLVWTVVPESLSPALMRANRRRRKEEKERERTAVAAGEIVGNGRVQKLFKFLSPLRVFAPAEIEVEGAGTGTLMKKRKDWSLTFLAAAYGFSILIMSSYQYKFQYAAATFGWSSEELGYWLSLIGASRAMYLTLVLPIIIKIFNPSKPAIQLPTTENEPLNGPSASSSSNSASDSQQPHPQPAQHTSAPLHPHSAAFDLNLARFSVGLEVVCYTIIPLTPTALTFTIFGMLASWGGGFNPAVQALALELFVRRHKRREEAETGRLFGALSVIQAMGSQILGPSLFGLVYMKTVARAPITIFFVSAACVAISFCFLSLVRLPPPTHTPSPRDPAVAEANGSLEQSGRRRGAPQREDTLVDTSVPIIIVDDEEARGRKKDGRQKVLSLIE